MGSDQKHYSFAAAQKGCTAAGVPDLPTTSCTWCAPVEYGVVERLRRRRVMHHQLQALQARVPAVAYGHHIFRSKGAQAAAGRARHCAGVVARMADAVLLLPETVVDVADVP